MHRNILGGGMEVYTSKKTFYAKVCRYTGIYQHVNLVVESKKVYTGMELFQLQVFTIGKNLKLDVRRYL